MREKQLVEESATRGIESEAKQERYGTTDSNYVFKFYIYSLCCCKVFCFRIFSASFLIIFLSTEIATSINTRSFFIILDYDILFIVRSDFVALHLLIPQYGYFIFMI